MSPQDLDDNYRDRSQPPVPKVHFFRIQQQQKQNKSKQL